MKKKLNRRSFLALVAGAATGIATARWIVRRRAPMMQIAARLLAQWKPDRANPRGTGECQITRFKMPEMKAKGT